LCCRSNAKTIKSSRPPTPTIPKKPSRCGKALPPSFRTISGTLISSYVARKANRLFPLSSQPSETQDFPEPTQDQSISRNGGSPAGVHHPDPSQSRTLNDPARRRSSVAVSPYGCPLPDLTRFDDQESEPLLRGARTSRPPAPAWDHLAQARRKEERWLYPTVYWHSYSRFELRKTASLPTFPATNLADSTAP
jgi:hypothetical protein